MPWSSTTAPVGDMTALTAALEQFLVLQTQAHDAQHGGWFEHFTPDWQPVMQPDEHVSVEVPGLQECERAPAPMEAFTELYLELPGRSGARGGGSSRCRSNRTHFYPPDPAQCAFHCRPGLEPGDRSGRARACRTDTTWSSPG